MASPIDDLVEGIDIPLYSLRVGELKTHSNVEKQDQGELLASCGEYIWSDN